MAKKKDTAANLGFEDQLWKAADKLRGNMDAAERGLLMGQVTLAGALSRPLRARRDLGEGMPTNNRTRIGDQDQDVTTARTGTKTNVRTATSDQTPYDPATNPNGPYSTPQPTVPEMVDFCQTFHRLDGEIVDGKINDGTPYRFPCVCKPS